MTSARLGDLPRMHSRFTGTVTWQRRSDRGGEVGRAARAPPSLNQVHRNRSRSYGTIFGTTLPRTKSVGRVRGDRDRKCVLSFGGFRSECRDRYLVGTV